MPGLGHGVLVCGFHTRLCYIPISGDIRPSKLKFVPEFLGVRESGEMRLKEFYAHVGYLSWALNVTWKSGNNIFPRSGGLSPTLYRVAIKASLYHKAVEVCYILIIKLLQGLIIKLLQGLNPEPDRINPQLLQKLSLEIAPILQAIFSRSLDEGSLPSDRLKANVSPIFKKGDKSFLSGS